MMASEEDEDMRIIISPAKKMNMDHDFFIEITTSRFLHEAEEILSHLRALNYDQLKNIWQCNDKITQLNYQRVNTMNLNTNLTPAILSYEGIQYQYMAPRAFTTAEFTYIQEHLRILSGFYGILRPLDGVTPYRLEMQAKMKLGKADSMYAFWQDKIAIELFSESKCIINLASKEYSKCITDYLKEDIQFITCVFGELKGDKVVEKGTKVKMARGEMVRFMAENQIRDVEEMKKFDRLNYTFSEKFSNEGTYVFIS